jgi:DNA-binding beta-propeller fold protein YncE
LISGETMPYVAVLDVATRKVIKKIPIGTGGAGILMAPYGLTAYVSCPPDNKVVAINLRSLTVTGTIETDKEPDGIAWANLGGTGTGVSP